MDKASVLGDAAKHIKHLQERMKALEEALSQKRCRIHVDEESSGENCMNINCNPNDEEAYDTNPEIDVRISDRNVLLKVYSKRMEGFTVRMLSEIEKLHLSIISTSVIPFANTHLTITIIAQVLFALCITSKCEHPNGTLLILRSLLSKIKVILYH